MFGIAWFLVISLVCIVVWRYRVADKKAREEMQRKYENK